MASHERVNVTSGLSVGLHHHWLPEAGSRPCWTAVSDGLRRVGQREVVVTLLDGGDQFPKGLLTWYEALHTLAVSGQTADAGDINGFTPPGPIGFGGFLGAVFQDAQPVAGVPVPGDALTAVLLREGELAMASVSVNRVLSALGRQFGYYPWPFWNDAERADVYTEEDAERSVLGQIPRTGMPDSTATLVSDRLTLMLTANDAARVAERLEAQEAAGVLPGQDPMATGALVWEPGQDQPVAITGVTDSEQRLSAWFVAFVPVWNSADTLRFLEDGCVALLSPGSQRELASALRLGAGWQLGGGEGYDLVVMTRR